MLGSHKYQVNPIYIYNRKIQDSVDSRNKMCMYKQNNVSTLFFEVESFLEQKYMVAICYCISILKSLLSTTNPNISGYKTKAHLLQRM